MSTENWAEERTRLLALLDELEAGRITRFDDPAPGDATPPASVADRIATIKQRLSALDERLGDSK